MGAVGLLGNVIDGRQLYFSTTILERSVGNVKIMQSKYAIHRLNRLNAKFVLYKAKRYRSYIASKFTLCFCLRDTLLNLLFGQDFDRAVRKDVAQTRPDGGSCNQIPTDNRVSEAQRIVQNDGEMKA